jgi:hypothetical protein
MTLSVKARKIIDTVILMSLLAVITVSGFSGLLIFLFGVLVITALSSLVFFLVSKAFTPSENLQMIEYSILSLLFASAFEVVVAAFFRESGEVMPMSLISIAISSILIGEHLVNFFQMKRSK